MNLARRNAAPLIIPLIQKPIKTELTTDRHLHQVVTSDRQYQKEAAIHYFFLSFFKRCQKIFHFYFKVAVL